MQTCVQQHQDSFMRKKNNPTALTLHLSNLHATSSCTQPSSLTCTVHPCTESAYPEHTSPVVAACHKIQSTPVGQPGAFKPLLVAPGKCLNISDDSTRSRFLPILPLRLAPGAATAGEAWYYLACTEIVHPIAANNKTDMVGGAILRSRLSPRW